MTRDFAMLEDKVVLISGAGPGLGRSLALRSAAAGARVVLAARTASRLETLADEVRAAGGEAVCIPTDLADPAAVAALAEQAVDAFGRVDTLIQNANVQPPQIGVLEAPLDDVREGLEINVLSALNLVRELAPELERSQGSVVMVNSMVLRNQLPGFGAYRVMKSGLLALARSLSIELGPRGVRVNSVAPGYIWAESVKRFFAWQAKQRGVDPSVVYAEVAAGTDLRRLPEPDDIANAAVFLASDLARAITGQCLDVNCGHTHH